MSTKGRDGGEENKVLAGPEIGRSRGNGNILGGHLPIVKTSLDLPESVGGGVGFLWARKANALSTNKKE